MAQDYDSCELVVNRITGGALLGWSFKLGESRLGSNDQTYTEVPISNASLTPNLYSVDADGALSLDPAIASIFMALHSPSPEPSPKLRYKDLVEITYDESIVFQGIVSQVSIEVELADVDTWSHRYSWTLQDTTAGMLNSGPGLISVPAEDPIVRLQRWFTVDISLLTPAQLAYIRGLQHEAQPDVDQTYLTWARQFTELTEVPLRVTPAAIPVWNRLQIYPHPVAWNGVPPTPEISSDDCSWLNTINHEQSLETSGALLPVRVTVPANDTRFLAGFEHITIPPVPLGQFVLGRDRLGTSGNVPVGFSAGSVVEIYDDIQVIAKLTHTFAHKQMTTEMDLTRPITINT